MPQETPKSPKDAWRESISRLTLPNPVVDHLEFMRFADIDELTGVELEMLPRDPSQLSPDERELSYIESSLSLPNRWWDEEARAHQRKIDAALKNRGRELIEKMGKERAREILKSLDDFGIQE